LVVSADNTNFARPFSSAEAACAAICVILPDSYAETNRVVRACARTLIKSWDAAETSTLRSASSSPANPGTIDRTFADFVEVEFERRCGRLHKQQTVTNLSLALPDTPFCRDVVGAWNPSADRSSISVGAQVNHLTSLADIVSLAR
jgi:hypothetical protein